MTAPTCTKRLDSLLTARDREQFDRDRKITKIMVSLGLSRDSAGYALDALAEVAAERKEAGGTCQQQ
jgi:hypothetical protein